MFKFSFRTKLVISFLLAGLIPLGSVGYFVYEKSSASLEREAVSKLVAVKNIKKEVIHRYFEGVADQVVTYADNIMIQDAMNEFTTSFNSLEEELEVDSTELSSYRNELIAFYRDQFGEKYRKENKKSVDFTSLISTLSPPEIILQYKYLADNTYELGNKHQLLTYSDKSSYSKVHKKYHPSIKKFQEKFGYYNIFLVDIETGNIVYSVFKELDFATSLKRGPYSNTNFAEVFNKASNMTDSGSFVLVDFELYTPSYESPASFIGTPIFKDGKKVGVLIFQMPIDRINAVMSERSGMGKTGETYIVGSDHLLRSDTFLDKEHRSVVSSFKHPDKGRVDSEQVRLALKGLTGDMLSSNYLGEEVISAYTPFNVLGLKWGLIAEISKSEAFAAVTEIKNTILMAAGICFVCLILIAILMSTRLSKDLARRVSAVAGKLSKTADGVGVVSSSILGSSVKLSEAATQQASSLQETVSSIDEISSMVQRNAEAAESSTSVSQRSNEAAMKGKETVETMMSSISSIAKDNEEIGKEVLRNNDELSKVVTLIGEIGEKTNVINDIVFQTKLLSFNASVEAARAGEHGKGFAVVAEEVGNLATMSGKAALEISEMLGNSIQQVEDIVKAATEKVENLMAQSQKNIEEGTHTAEECERVLSEILNNVSSVNEMVREIATASSEQSSGVNEVTKAMQELDQTTHQNTAIAQESATTARQLKSQADELNQGVKELLAIVNSEKQNTNNQKGEVLDLQDRKEVG
ncbi:MAG: hypothetical protein CME64_02730 [Halobacteriovoraceae bacterium]|nr:hypothetical protein [Halobacteriovoraceae bacterium]